MNYKNKLQSDCGFMGSTHALSALAIYLLITALFPEFVFGNILKTEVVFVYIASVFIVSGFVAFPDFDNTQSTAISTLGVIGKAISKALRAISVFFYKLIKSKKDDPTPNPHRGFWHTLVAVVVIGLIVTLTSSIPFKFTIPLLNKQVTIGFIIAVVWLYISIKLTIAGVFRKFNKKLNKKSGLNKLNIFVELLSVTFAISALILSPGTINYSWIGACASIGYLIHLLGDTLTVAGTPLLWPLKHKGKRWWTYRIVGIKAGGEIETILLSPVFTMITIFSIFKIIGYFVGN